MSLAQFRKRNEAEHRKRYGKGRARLTRPQLQSITESLCHGDEHAPQNLMLLMDEIERSTFDHDAIGEIVMIVQSAAFAESVACGELLESELDRIRREAEQGGKHA